MASAAERRRHAAQRADVTRAAALSVLVVTVAVGIGYGAMTLADDPRFALQNLEIDGGVRTGADAIAWAAALPQGHNVWLFDTGAAQRRVAALPWVASANIERAWPNRVTVHVVERSPAVRLALSPGEDALLDGEGRVLQIGGTGADAALPQLKIVPPPPALSAGAVLQDDAVAEGLQAAQRLRAIGLPVSEIRQERVAGLSVVTGSGLRVLFGNLDDFERKVALFAAISKRIAHPGDVAYVDVRSTVAPTVQYR